MNYHGSIQAVVSLLRSVVHKLGYGYEDIEGKYENKSYNPGQAASCLLYKGDVFNVDPKCQSTNSGWWPKLVVCRKQ